MIDDTQETLVIPYDAGARDAITALCRDGPSRGLLRRLQPYTVPVQRSAMKKLREALAVEDFDGGTVLKDEALYDREVGLRIEELVGARVDDFIV
jgi:hypothetical protein